jgi:hypothetical protein
VSLRARLLIGLVVLTAAGLLVAGLVTYRAERSFLIGRVDSQVRASVVSVETRLGEQVGPDAPSGFGSDPDHDGDGGPSPGPPGSFGPPAEGLADPAGTFGERLRADGERVGKPVASDFDPIYAPKLPTNLDDYLTYNAHDLRYFTAPASGKPGLSYRVLALPYAGGVTIVAVSLGDVSASLARLRDRCRRPHAACQPGRWAHRGRAARARAERDARADRAGLHTPPGE